MKYFWKRKIKSFFFIKKNRSLFIIFSCYKSCWSFSKDKGPFGLTYFLAYAKQLMQINKFLCTILKLVKVGYKKRL